jgi:hypothetical protein
MDEAWTYWLLRIARAILGVVEVFTDLIFGHTYSGGTKEERAASKLYRNSAHVVTVKWRAHYNWLWFHFKENFIYKHDKYIHPRYILQHKNVTLFTVTKDYAMFCITDPDVDIYETTKHPFVFIAQYEQCKKLLFLPISSLYMLAEELGDPKVHVVINHMTTRCGSTLLSQMFHRLPVVRVLSEPWAACTLQGEAAVGNITQVSSLKSF